MKTLYLRQLGAAAIVLFTIGCNKADMAVVQSKNSDPVASFKKKLLQTQMGMKESSPESQQLIRLYNQWIFGRDFSINPLDDATGAKQFADQPLSSGTMMLGSGISPDLQTREITISIAQYQNIFIGPLAIIYFYGSCTPDYYKPNGKLPFGYSFHSYQAPAFNNHNADVVVKWDGASLVPKNQSELRSTSGIWEFMASSSWGFCESISTFYADGFYSLVPLSLGNHTLEVFGSAYYPLDKSEFSNHVIYHLNIIP